jgi:ParB/RepB/Spo0J family partition protein
MSDIFFGMEEELKTNTRKATTKRDVVSKSFSTTESLNFGNISKELTFNNGSEGYFKVRPKALIESSHNPRPDWKINDEWLKKHVHVDFDDVFEDSLESDCLVRIEETEVDGNIIEDALFPTFDELDNSPDPSAKPQYEFLIELAQSIRLEGQIQPIEVESSSDNKSLVVLEGHLRRLACILGRVPYLKAIRNEGLHGLSKEEKVGRQISENSVRKDVSLWGKYLLVESLLQEHPKLTIREVSERLKLNKTLVGYLVKLYASKSSPKIPKALELDLITTRNLGIVLGYKQISAQEQALKKILKGQYVLLCDDGELEEPKVQPKGSGRTRTVSSLQIKSKENCVKAGNRLLELVPELSTSVSLSEVQSVEDMDKVLKSFLDYLLKD